MNFKLSNEIYEELISNKYPTLFEIEIGGKEKIRVVRYEDYKKLENTIKEVREIINKAINEGYDYQEKDNLLFEGLEILDKEREGE